MEVESKNLVRWGLGGALLLLVACSGLGAATERANETEVPLVETEAPTPEGAAAPLTEEMLKNAIYNLEWVSESPFQLEDGAYEHAYGDEATMVDTVGMNQTAIGDLDGDGTEDAAVILWHHSGGTGVFVHLVVMRNGDEGPQQVASLLLGDRAQVEQLDIEDGGISLEMLVHGPDDPMCCPSQRTKQRYQLEEGALTLVAEELLELSVEGPEEVTETVMVTYLPELPDDSQAGNCWTSSIAAFGRADAWRCMVENAIYDPCFQLEGETVVCGADPLTGEAGFRLELTEPLPEPDLPADAEPSAWMVALADGTVCGRATGAMGFVDEKPTTFYCRSDAPEENVVLLGDLQPGNPWMAEKAVLSRGEEIAIQNIGWVAIRTLYR